MKSIKFTGLILALIVALAPIPSFSQEKGDVKEIIISKNTSRQELEKMVNDLKEEGIDMAIQEVKYNSRDKVVKIRGEINFNDGNTADFEAQRIKKIVIIRDYRPEAEKPLYILFNPKE